MSHPKYKNIGHPLDCLIEECAELIHACAKAKRFGLDNYNPYIPNSPNNKQQILIEIHDVKERMERVEKWICFEEGV
jgi:hypothetical protein